jgi:glucose-6-phosphate isomerase
VARLAFDYTNVLADAVGLEHGIAEADLAALAAPTRAAVRAVQARRARDLRWLDLPHDEHLCERVLEFAAEKAGRFDNVVVLGIGGSALGTSACQAALGKCFHNLAPGDEPRLFVLDNVDPDPIAELLELLDPARTLFNVISKSGGTAETMAQFLIMRQALIGRVGHAAHAEHLVVTTDAEKGVLREIVRREGYASFEVPDGVGGRFSVLSAVGLVPLSLVGVDVAGLLAGAAEMDQRCRSEELLENPAAVHAAVQWLLHSKKAKPIAVTFAYSQRLAALGDWYAQLLGESIGKRTSRSGKVVHAGPTPVRALGVTDQHSQVQLYVEGPFDKWFQLLAVEAPARNVAIPAGPERDLEGVSYLHGRTLGELFAAERDGTAIALTEALRPNATFRFPSITPATVGQFLQLAEVSVALMGEHYDVDAFDQPGVEAGKIAAYALMGRKGYEGRRREIETSAARQARRV